MLPSSALRVSAMMGTSTRLLPNFTTLTPPSRTCARLISTTSLARERDSIKSPHIQVMMRKERKDRRIDGADAAAVDIDAIAEEEALLGNEAEGEFQRFPDDDVYHMMFSGVKFTELPVVTMYCQKNNTRLWAHDHKGKKIAYTAPVHHGYKNAAKMSPIASQAAGTGMGQQLRNLNIRTVRVRVDGFNKGREAAVKGITIAGVQVVSISDITRVDWGWTKRAKRTPYK